MPWVKRRPPPRLHTHDRTPIVPLPHGFFSGRRSALRRFLARAIARVDRTVEWLPGGRWLHRRALDQLELHEVEIPLRRGGRGLDGLRIAFVSDVHAGMCLDEADLGEIFTRVAAAAPDVVCLGGDLINTREREILLYREPLKHLQPPLGVHAIAGNHEHFFGRDWSLITTFLEKQGVNVLHNRGVRLEHGGASLWLCGVDDLTEGEPDVDAALAGRSEDEPAVLLSHHPDLFLATAAAGVDLTLAGHTHGGQLLFFGWTPLQHTAFGWWRGHYRELDSHLYVGRGVGTTLLPLRRDARPEIPVLRLRAPAATLQE